MTLNGWLQIGLFVLILTLITKPLGLYLAAVFGPNPQEGSRGRTFLDPVLRPVERLLYRLMRVDENKEQTWQRYATAMLIFSVVTMIVTYLVQRLQGLLPLNPAQLGAVKPDLAFNTAVSFTSNTNWQSYYPEQTMSYLTQMTQLSLHNFLSAAVGIAVAVAFVRGIARREMNTLGNFWVDVTRAILYVLLPVCLIYAIFLTSQGVVQNFSDYTVIKTVEGATQTIPQGPVASQEAIKMFGTNGGGYFNANSAHPFENPNPLTNFVQMLSIFAIGAGLTYMLGVMVGNRRQGWAIYGAMLVLFLAVTSVMYSAEASGNPNFHGVNQAAVEGNLAQAGGNMEGKEVRFGTVGSALFASVTTAASCGAVNAMHDSFTPLGGLGPLFNMAVGEVIFGGVGAGLYGILIFIILAVFIAGLMVGRTPEFLGKKIEAHEMKLVMLGILILELSILGFSALTIVNQDVVAATRWNPGPHGLTEFLYAYTSGTANNGSAFAGISANTNWMNTTLAIAMLLGRWFFIIPVLAIAGSLGRKKLAPQTAGTFPTTGPLFVGLLVGVIVIVSALTFFPVWSLGPIVEHILMGNGSSF